MATVVSLTEAKIRELLLGWEGVALSQDQINDFVAALAASQDSVLDELTAIRVSELPSILVDVQAATLSIEELNNNIIPSLNVSLDQAQLDIQNVLTVEVPALQAELQNEVENGIARTKVFMQPEPPEPYDDLDERELVPGDVWYDTDDNNKQHIWTGVEWSTFAVEVGDFTLTVKKFLTNTHQIY